MTDEIKHIDIEEFADLGFMQEVNRLVLHPAGLALERSSPWTEKDIEGWVAEVNADRPESIGQIDPVAYIWAFVKANGMDKWHLSGVWDYRDDPEGVVYGANQMTEEKRANVRAEWEKHRLARNDLFGGDDGVNWPGRVQHIDEEPRV